MKHGRVLLADSHLGMLGGVHGLLDALFETVLMVADEQSLMEATATFKPELVVVDLSLPKLGEANIVTRLIRQHSDVSVVVLSVHDDPTVANMMLKAGAAGYVLKRTAAEDLALAVNEALHGGVFVSPWRSVVEARSTAMIPLMARREMIEAAIEKSPRLMGFSRQTSDQGAQASQIH